MNKKEDLTAAIVENQYLSEREINIETRLSLLENKVLLPLHTASYNSPPLDEDDEHTEKRKLPEDTYSMMTTASIWPISKAFITSLIVFSTQVMIFSLVLLDTVDYSSKINPFAFPHCVSDVVRIAQFYAIVITVLMQDDIQQSLGSLRDGYDHDIFTKAFSETTRTKWLLSALLRLLMGIFGLIVSFVLIMQAETVMDILYNFAALKFINEVDNMTFTLIKQGIISRSLKAHAEKISNTKYPSKRRDYFYYIIHSVLITTLAIWVIIFNMQISGYFAGSSIFVQFGDDFSADMGAFSGVYDHDESNLVNGRVCYRERNSGKAMFGYCDKEKVWTFTYKMTEEENLDPCNNWKARSLESETFDILQTASSTWFTKNEGSEELPFHFMMMSYQYQENNEVCGGNRGSLDDSQVNPKCKCNPEYFGLFCEFDKPCPSIAINEQHQGFLGTRSWSKTYELLRFNNGTILEVYGRPVYINQDKTGLFDIIIYTGRRWCLTYSGFLYSKYDKEESYNITSIQGLISYLENFHAYYYGYKVAFISEEMDYGTPIDAATPLGLAWFHAEESRKGKERNTVQAVNPNRPMESFLLCALCHNTTNPCSFDNLCNSDGKCECIVGGTSGTLCQVNKGSNGKCDPFFNTIEFAYDGGDCCQVTCVSSEESDCGKHYVNSEFDVSSVKYVGYPNCKDPDQLCNPPSDSCWMPNTKQGIVGEMNGRSGWSVSLSRHGNILAVNEPGADRVRIFEQDGSQLTQRGNSIQGPVLEKPSDVYFGFSISMSSDGNVVTAGSSGKIQVFEWETGSSAWIPQGLEIDGWSASLSSDGSILAVGNPYKNHDDEEASENTGQVRVYHYDWKLAIWNQRGQDLVGEGDFDYFGWSVSLSSDGNTLAVGSPQRDNAFFKPDPGYVRAYKYDTNTSWTQFGAKITGDGFGDMFGRSISTSGDGTIMAVGAPSFEPGNGFSKNEVANTGHVRVYKYLSNWTLLGKSIEGKESFDEVGHSVSISSDGTILAVGAPGFGMTKTDDKKNVGFARVYKYDPIIVNWVQVGRDINPKPDGIAGFSVALSNDGKVLSVGSPFDYSNGDKSGRVMVYTDVGDITSKVNITDPESTISLVNITVVIQLDAFPEDIFVWLKCDNTIHVKVNLDSHNITQKQKIMGIFNVKEGADCTFTIGDIANNGICCNDGQGFYRIYYGENTSNPDNLLVRGGQLFRFFEEVTFKASPPSEKVPFTIIVYLGDDTFGQEARLKCGDVLESVSPLDDLSPYSTLNETYLVEEGTKCTFKITSPDAVDDMDTVYISIQVYYGEGKNTENIIAGVDSSFFQDELVFLVSPDVVVPTPIYVPITFKRQLDNLPEQIGYSFECDNNFIFKSPIGTFEGYKGRYDEHKYFIKKGRECQFIVEDKNGNGICCDYGKGFLSFSYGHNILPLDDGDYPGVIFNFTEFGFEDIFNFTVSWDEQDKAMVESGFY